MLTELRHAVRSLARARYASGLGVVTLSIGIGAISATFHLVDRALLEPLPFDEPDGLVAIWERRPIQGRESNPVSPADFYDWRSEATSFESMAAFSPGGANLTGAGGESFAERISSARVSSGFFELLGRSPQLGRTFSDSEEAPGRDGVVVLGHGLWQRRFGGRASVVGRTIHLDGVERTIVGVMPVGFDFPFERELWLPLALSEEQRPRASHYLFVVARLSRAATLASARTEMDAVARRLERAHPEVNEGHLSRIVPLREELLGELEPSLWMLFGVSAIVWLIACANVATLFLARGLRREKRTAISAALGASRARLARAVLLESILLAAAGAAGGLGIGWILSRALVAVLPTGGELPAGAWDVDTLLFALAASAASAAAFGLAPALRASASRPGLSGSDSRSTQRGPVRIATRALVVVELALALVLVLAAGLLLASFDRLSAVDPGFRPEGVLTAEVALSPSAYAETHRRARFYQRVLEDVASIPDVRAAGATSILPLSGREAGRFFKIENRATAAGAETPNARLRIVSPDYFRAIGMSLLAGRGFRMTDDADAAPVVVINETMRRRYWPHDDPVGARIGFGEAETPWYTVVGVVGDVRHSALQAKPNPHVYLSLGQEPPDAVSIVARADSDPLSLGPRIRAIVRSLDENQPVARIELLSEIRDRSIAHPRQLRSAVALFALVALLLAAGGVYGLVSYWTSQRRAEMAIRLALGARWEDVFRLVLREGMGLVARATAIAMAGYLVAGSWLARFLYDVTPFDAPTLVSGVALLAAVGALAVYVPARRASRIEPVALLRST